MTLLCIEVGQVTNKIEWINILLSYCSLHHSWFKLMFIILHVFNTIKYHSLYQGRVRAVEMGENRKTFVFPQ